MLIRAGHLPMKESQEFGMEYRQQWGLDIWDLGIVWIGMSGVWAPEGSVGVVDWLYMVQYDEARDTSM
jgi:hypothetical protein